MLNILKEQVWQANLDLVRHNLVILTWGNASAVDRREGLMVIKPSGVSYEELKPEHLVVLDLDKGNVVEGNLNPSSDTPTHLFLYQVFPAIGGIVHTHSPWATAWAQAGKGIPALGTTHADYFQGTVPCTRKLTAVETEGEYERETGQVIAESFKNIDPISIPGALVNRHGPFTWGNTVNEAVHNAAVLEEIAKIAYQTINLNTDIEQIDQRLLNRHFLRKHGRTASYGQQEND